MFEVVRPFLALSCGGELPLKLRLLIAIRKITGAVFKALTFV